MHENVVAQKPRWLRSMSTAVITLLVALVAARSSSYWIGVRFPDRPRPPDLLFDTLLHVPKVGYLADIAVVAAIILLLVYAFHNDAREIPAMMTLYGLMQISRAFINLLTPLASPLAHSTYYGLSTHLERSLSNALPALTSAIQNGAYQGASVSSRMLHVTQNGEFPSGHMASVFMCMLLVDGAKSPRIKAAMIALAVIEGVSLLMSHQHYSIDLVGGMLLSYFLVHEYAEGTWLDWLKPLVRV